MNLSTLGAILIATQLAIPAFGQKESKTILSMPKWGGYIIGRYQHNTNEASDNAGGGFDLRMVRAYVEGTMLNDFRYYLQLECSGAPGTDKGVRLLDAYLEWKKYPTFTVRFGQMKRAFTFENPYNPWNLGTGNYSQLTQKLAGMSDRVGEHSSGGRDAGLLVQGDFFPVTDGHRWLHYQVGIYNGQGINHSDKDKSKDVIGGLWISPTEDLQIGAFTWRGRYVNDDVKVKRNRMAYGIKYENDWTFRAEYASSQGGKTDNVYAAEKADAWYMTLGVPISSKFKVYGSWDVYRDEKSRDTQNTLYILALDYWLWKNLLVQATYSYTDANNASYTDMGERSIVTGKYHTTMLQVYIRF